MEENCSPDVSLDAISIVRIYWRLDLLNVEDVYSANTNASAPAADVRLRKCIFKISAEDSTTSLSRIFGLLCTLSIIPASTKSRRRDNETLELMLIFEDLRMSTADRLERMISRLPETIQYKLDQRPRIWSSHT